MNKSLITGNWKSNPASLKEAENLFNSIKKGIKNIKNTEVVICPPFVYISNFKSESFLKLGAQNVFWENGGAFTGEISSKMLKDLGCEYVILGHSERRKYLKETCSIVNKKIKIVLSNNLIPILCVDNIGQIRRGLKGVARKEIKKVIIAYEPTFAIGTGRACSLEKARKMNSSIRKIVGEKSIVFYGGSVNSKNARDYINKARFQGLLIGGSSLNAKEFVKIVQSVDKL